MTPETWLTLFKWMSGISAAFVAISLVGQLYFSSIVDKNKDKKISSLERESIKHGEELSFKDKQINKLESELRVEKATIRDFDSDLQIVISGNWSTSPASYIPVSPVDGDWYIVFTKDKTNDHPIRFMATQQYSFNNVNQNKVIFVSRQAVLKGEYPTGQSIDVLSDYDTINFYIPFKGSTNDIEGKKILIEQVAIKFFLNSKRCNDILYNKPLEVQIDDNGWATFNIKNKKSNLFEQLQLEQKL